MSDNNTSQIPTSIAILFKVAGVIVFLLLIYYLRYVLIPFATAFIIAYMLNPVVIFFQKFTRKRWIAIAITLLITVAFFSTILIAIIPKFVRETLHLYSLITENDFFTNWKEILPPQLKNYLDSINTEDKFNISPNNSDFITFIESGLKTIIPQLTSFFNKTYNLIASILGGFVILLYLVFIMNDFDEISQGLIDLIPERYKDRFIEFFNRFSTEMQKYFRGQLTIVFIVMILFAIGFEIVGLPLGAILGIFIGILNIVPYLQIAGFLPALILCMIKSLEDGTPLPLVIGSVIAVFAIVQVIQDAYLTPKIIGKNTGMNPAMILLSLSIWGKLLGFLGFIVAIPFSCLIMIYYAEYKEKLELRHKKIQSTTS